MGLLRGPDFIYALRFLRLLTTPWQKTSAFKLGLVDKNGKVLKKPVTSEEKSAYNVFHKLVYNIKRLINKLPLGKSTIASYAAALFLIKEHASIDDENLKEVLKEVFGLDLIDDNTDHITEWYLNESGQIEEGKYALTRDIALPKTGELLAKKDTLVQIMEQSPCGTVFGYSVFKGLHENTKQMIYITQEDIVK